MILHFEGLRHILLLTAYAWTSDTMYGKIDGTFLGTISITVRSSTNLARGSQRPIRLLTITANSIRPKRVPWGMPPFNLQGGEEDVASLTTCDLPSRNDAIYVGIYVTSNTILSSRQEACLHLLEKVNQNNAFCLILSLSLIKSHFINASACRPSTIYFSSPSLLVFAFLTPFPSITLSIGTRVFVLRW